MKAAVHYQNGSPSVLRYQDVPAPELEPRDVLIRVQAISIEGGDILNRRMVAPVNTPHTVGYQAAGIIEAVGLEVRHLAVGQRVAAFNWAGSHAELFRAPEHFVYPIPDRLDINIAATVPVTFGTASDALFEFGRLGEGETVLIRGGTGGVGIAAIQLAKAAGAVVLATSSNDRNSAALKELGADHIINYLTQDVVQEALRVTQNRGVDLLVDPVGGPYLSSLTNAVRYRGRVCIVGAMSGEPFKLGFLDIVSRSLSFIGILFGREMHLPRVHQMLAQRFDEVAAGSLKMPIDRVFTLAEAAAAHAYVENDHPFGRVVMTP